MKTTTKLLSLALLSGFAFVALAQDAPSPSILGMKTIMPNDCHVNTVNDQVHMLVSIVENDPFIMCNATMPVKNQAAVLFPNGADSGTVPASPWVANPDGHKSFVCADKLAKCSVMYRQ